MFVCTAAERPYALEVWRMLDPEGVLIEPKYLQRRIVNVNVSVGRKKASAHRFDCDDVDVL